MSSTSQYSSSSANSGNLFVSFLPPTYSNESLKVLFAPFGEIDTCKVMVDLNTGLSKGFGFVKFKDVASAQYAINSMNGMKVENKTLLVRFANSEPLQQSPSLSSSSSSSSSGVDEASNNSNNSNNTVIPSSNVFIKGLPIEYTMDQLKALFSPHGDIADSKILTDISTNASRGQALVRYTDIQSATKAVKELNGYIISHPDKPLIVKFAENEEEKKQKRQKLQQKQRLNMRFSPYPAPIAAPITQMYPYYQTMPTLTTTLTPIMQPPMLTSTKNITPQDPTNLYVYNLPSDADDALLYRLFSPSGAIASVKIVRDPNTQVCKGYGFVRMLTLQDSYTAINSINGVQVGGKTISVSFKK